MFFQTNGVNIFYQCAGEGKPILLLHGWGGCGDSFKPVFNALSASARVYAIDFPGHGQSDIPQTPWSVGDFAEATRAFMQAMDIVGCDVIAHSFGGRVVIKLAGTDPGLFSKIVLTGAAGIRPRRGAKYYVKVYSYKLFKRMAKHAWMCKLCKCVGLDVQKRTQNAGSADYRALPESMRRTFSLVVNEDLKKYLRHIQNPTLLIWGADDQDAPLWMGQIMEKEIRDSGLVVYENAGHFAYLERLPNFVAVVSHFLLSEETA